MPRESHRKVMFWENQDQEVSLYVINVYMFCSLLSQVTGFFSGKDVYIVYSTLFKSPENQHVALATAEPLQIIKCLKLGIA